MIYNLYVLYGRNVLDSNLILYEKKGKRRTGESTERVDSEERNIYLLKQISVF